MNKVRSAVVALFTLVALPALADGSKVSLGGYCPVAYTKANQAVFGNPQYASEYQGKTYFFVNEGAKKMFDKAPASFTTAMKYDAWCATAMAMGKKLASDPTLFSVVDGAVYFFSSAQAKAAFDKDPGSFIKKADAAFASLK